MTLLSEYVGCVHIFLGPYRGNPIALYLRRTESGCQIGPKVYPWNDVLGVGETPNKAAADFEEKWKVRGLAPDMYSGPAWEGGIKPEKPAPPKPAAAAKPAVAPAAQPAPPPQATPNQPVAPQVPTPQPPQSSQPNTQAEAAVGSPVTPAEQAAAPPSSPQPDQQT
ncbi:MAG: hypothetical protein OEY86_06295 [Nitrospira sp.]|nr:hypothetical protein [Nitrospira sp.]